MLRKRIWLIALGLVALTVVFAPATPAAGQRLVVQIDEPFEVQGQLFQRGELSIRTINDFSPVSTLNEVRVDGRCLGMLMARDSNLRRNAADEFIFTRAQDGHLVLEAVAFAGQATQQLYELRENANGGGEWHATTEGPQLLVAAK